MAQIFGNLTKPNQFNNKTHDEDYMSECFSSSEFYKGVIVPCDIIGNNTNITCSGALGVSHDEEAIILMFRGTNTNAESDEENIFANITTTFPGGGTVHKFWYEGFLSTWKAGLSNAFFSAKNQNPTYELWTVGWSMGGSMAAISAGYISQLGYIPKDQIKLVTFGQPRIGFADLAARFPSLVPYTYRVTHHLDYVPHTPPTELGYVHFKNEIWYNNSMLEGSQYIECDAGESLNCSDSVHPDHFMGDEHWHFNNTGYCKRGNGQTPSAFVHPGLLHTQADFDRMAKMVAANATPWVSSWNILINNSHASLSYTPSPQKWLCRGDCCINDNSASLFNDIAAAYQLALIWKISGNNSYADKAAQIMNAWSSTLTGIGCENNVSSDDCYLLAGIQGYQFANVGEIMRNYSGLSAANFTAFQNMMRNIFYPYTVLGWPLKFWSNWDLCSMATTMAISVLTDNQTMFDSVLTYFYNGSGNGAIGNTVYYMHPGYLGQTQESGRDQGHDTLDISHLGVIAEQAWNQGIDLYGYANNRILAASEYVARGNLIQSGSTYYSNPFATYIYNSIFNFDSRYDTVFSNDSVGNERPAWAKIYNHYVNRKGLAAPYTQKMMNVLAPDGGGGNYGFNSGGFDQFGFETLTFTLQPIAQGSPPSGLTGYFNASNVQLSWWGTYNASSYNVLRGTVSGGPYKPIALGIVDPLTYTDSDLAAGTYYYVVTAQTPSGVSNASNEAKVIANALALNTYLTFDQSSGTVAVDSSGNGHNATLVGGASFVPGKINNAVSLDGSTGYVSLPAGITSNLSDFTIAAWLKLNSLSKNVRLFDFGFGTGIYMMFTPQGNNGNATFSITTHTDAGELSLNCSSPLPLGQWVHVAITLFGQVATYYVNGSISAMNSGNWLAPFQIAGRTSLMPQNWIGRSQYSGDPYLNGLIDDFRIYQGALTASQIAALYSQSG